MQIRKWSLTWVVVYLTVGGLGFLLVPGIARDLLLSNRDYDDVGFRLAGTMMVAIAYLVWNILRNEDWKYYPVSIYVRTGIVVVLTALFVDTDDPMFLVLDGIVLLGLLPSIYVHFGRER